MTADIALAALYAGFVLLVESQRPWQTVPILACAVLKRETAALIVAGYCLFLLTQRQIARSIAAACALLPAGAWFLYVTHGAAKSEAVGYLNWIPLYGFLERVIHPAVYRYGPLKTGVVVLFDFIALLGFGLMLVFVARMAIRRRWSANTAAIYALVLAAVFLGKRDVWEDAYNFGRVLSPLLFLTFMEHFRAPSVRRLLTALAPMALIDLRISLNTAGELEAIVRGLLK